VLKICPQAWSAILQISPVESPTKRTRSLNLQAVAIVVEVAHVLAHVQDVLVLVQAAGDRYALFISLWICINEGV